MTSSASSRSSAGRIVGRRRASIVLPTPGGPTISRWCRAGRGDRQREAGVGEAADVGEVERLVGVGVRRRRAAGSGGSGHGASPFRHACSSPSVRATRTCTPGTSAASAALAAGTMTCSTPGARERVDERERARRPAAPRRRGRARRARRRRRARPAGSPPSALVSASATASSSPAPVLRTDAGARFTVTRFCGYSSPDDSSAARTRSRDSRPAASGRPTTV